MDNTTLKHAFSLCRRSLVAVGAFSFMANLLMLTPAFFMLNVYDKAVAFSSLPTLWVLSAIALFLFVMLAAIEAVRAKVLIAVASRLDKVIGPKLYQFTLENAVRVGGSRASVQPLSDLNGLRQFITSTGVFAFFDAPWLPIYLAIMFLFHPMLGWLGVLSASLLVVVAYLNERFTAPKIALANQQARAVVADTQRNLRNAEAIAALGMASELQSRWRQAQDSALGNQEEASSIASNFQAATKTLRIATQSAAIAAGAFLVVQQEISPGMLIAGSILIGRALSPVEQLVSSWKGFVDARDQYSRIEKALSVDSTESDGMRLPSVTGKLTCRNAMVVPPGQSVPAIANVNFDIPAGKTCLVVGPSGAGKSTLIKALMGLWPTTGGEIRIDGNLSSNFSRKELGPQIGFLPQGIELLEGSLSANIARFGEVDPQAVIKAATDAGVHELILSFPDGYDTQIGAEGFNLSPGQAQRIALARALYGGPALVFMDEPNSNLDDGGDRALYSAIESLKNSGSTIVIVSHRNSILPLADLLLVMSNGRSIDFGPTPEVLARLQSPKNKQAASSQAVGAGSPAPITTVPVKS